MIDVHPPHESAHNWRDVVIHLAIITVGLFIALSLEGCVEWFHHRHLVREARENIRAEIQDNQRDVRDALKEIKSEEAADTKDIETLKKMLADVHADKLSLNLRFSGTQLANASWNTARETGALGYMSYPEVKTYAAIYTLQDLFADQTNRMIAAYTVAMPSLSDMGEDKPKPQREKGLNDAIQHIYAILAQLQVEEAAGRELDRQYTEALKKQF